MLNKNEILLLEDFSDYNRFTKFQPIDDRLHVNERFSIIIDHRNNTTRYRLLENFNTKILYVLDELDFEL